MPAHAPTFPPCPSRPCPIRPPTAHTRKIAGTLTATRSRLATAGAAKVLGADHSVTKALARAAITMATVDLWKARLAIKTLRRDQREAISETAEV